MTIRGVTRHEKFAASVARLVKKIPRINEMVEAAIWSIARDPEGDGVRNALVGVWQATIITGDSPHSPRVILFYTFSRRLVHFLTVKLDTSKSN